MHKNFMHHGLKKTNEMEVSRKTERDKEVRLSRGNHCGGQIQSHRIIAQGGSHGHNSLILTKQFPASKDSNIHAP